MPYQLLKHTADVRVRVWGKTKEELFEEAAYALLKVMHPLLTRKKGTRPQVIKRRLVVNAGNITELLVDFLNQILTSAQTNKETYQKVYVHHLYDRGLEAELDAVDAQEFGEDVKAVTYHEAEVKQNKEGEWETLLVLDI